MTFLQRSFTQTLTSPALRDMVRTWHGIKRKVAGRQPVVHYFHQVDDPYSYLTALQLQDFQDRYQVQLLAHLVPAPEDSAAPDQERLRDWSARDAARLAQSAGWEVPDFQRRPEPRAIAQAQAGVARILRSGHSPRALAEATVALWSHAAADQTPPTAEDKRAAQTALLAGQALRRKLGHYLGATFFFEGEWYWGVDRLHYLEQRLQEAGLSKATTRAYLLPPPALALQPVNSSNSIQPVIHFYCSLRSPYTYVAAVQLVRLAQHYGAELRLRFVLPMVMRGLPVPLAKRLYIMRDTKREADRAGIRFGCTVDPVGAPTERGLATLHRAIGLGKGSAFIESFLQGVFADGIDAGSAGGLLAIASRAGLNQADVDAALADPSWRDVAEANRTDMLERGLWGVPSFRVNEMPALWGQDRLWMLERDLVQSLQSTAKNENQNQETT